MVLFTHRTDFSKKRNSKQFSVLYDWKFIFTSALAENQIKPDIGEQL